MGKRSDRDHASAALAKRILRTYLPVLPRDLWLLEGTILLQGVGAGMTIPFTTIYLYNVRGFSLAAAGCVGAVFAGCSLLATFLGGELGDRFPLRAPLYLSLVTLASGYSLFALAHSLALAFIAFSIVGIGNGVYWPLQASLMASLASPTKRDQAFALRASLTNVSLGVGGAAGGLLAVTSRPHTFTALFLIDAALILLSLLLIVPIHMPRRAPVVQPKDKTPYRAQGWRALWHQHTIMVVVGVNILCMAAGYAVFDMVLPIFAKNSAHLSGHVIGAVFAVNAVAVLLLQMPFLKLARGRDKMHVLAAMCVVWAALWLGVSETTHLSRGLIAACLLALGAIFAIGECILPLLDGLVANIVPDALRSKGLGSLTAARGLGTKLGQLSFGFVLEYDLRAAWYIAAGLLLLTALGALFAARHVPKAFRAIE